MKLKAPGATAATARSPINWFPGIFLAAFLTIIYASSAIGKTGARGLNPAEEWVVAQATAGKIADLDGALNADHTKKFPEEKDRKLSAQFLEDLLTGTLPGVKMHRHGVRIIGAIIDESIDLRNAQIPWEVWLDHCQFNKNATFGSASSTRVVSFDGSTFNAEATFDRMKVGDIFFRRAVFEGPVNFASADIAGQFVASGAQFQNKEQGATFNSMKVRGHAFFSNAVFEGSVNFVSADIAGNFAAQEAKFQNKEKEASFNGMKVGGHAFFRNAVFEGPANFSLADFTSNFDATGAKFQNKEKGANFNSMKVGGHAFFIKAVFEGPVDFVRADVTSNFEADEAKFQDKEKGASFGSMKVGQNALFKKAVFEGPVDFGYADLARLDLSSSVLPKVAAQFRMQGMIYKYIRAVPKNEPESHKALLKLADQSAYTADVYSNLEEFFYARAIAPMQTKLSLQENVGSEKNTFAALLAPPLALLLVTGFGG